MTPRLTRSFGVVSSAVMRDADLSSSAKTLYSLLATYADNDNGTCWPSNETLANDLAVTPRGIQKWMRELEEHGVLARETRYVDGRQTTNVIRLTDIRSSRDAQQFTPEDAQQFVPGGEPVFVQNKTSSNKTTRNTLSPAPEATTAERDAAFEEWWKLYPKKTGKQASKAVWLRLTGKEGFDPAVLVSALEFHKAHYADRETRYWKDPERWLGKRLWQDDLHQLTQQPTESQFDIIRRYRG